ncbi:hypothetical protein BKA83DRAFT_4123716 [Pisolithus microcarpus]|nr:hypothetical protein BKA83DRAFT_4124394 [Pisolithus microcarpus]KAI6026838.1 hypothetical protein BKA83DRAFT_4124415 [Pisolithus microcarpus]KAI6026858.1 hypothetical protein BKA83DRAFT_4124429 [Pisolithus microcarpus]KAI6026921.1 hypothetical protein BKA83DRAFT_4124483 [Pisolithus microcarpus]KAI6027827.1 hypothetical protein BKA83DRAFT_4123716 [Pisolithus microcarpus]
MLGGWLLHCSADSLQWMEFFVRPHPKSVSSTIAEHCLVVTVGHLNVGVGMVRRGNAQTKETVVGGPTRRSTRPTAGQGGAVAQLEKVGKAVETPHRHHKPQVVLSNDEHVNPMAPTTRRGRRTPRSARTTSQAQDQHTYMSSGAEGSSSRFGLRTDGSQQPSFVGTQSLQDYEQSRTSSVHVSTGGLSSVTQGCDSGPTENRRRIGSFPNTSRGKAVAGRQRLDRRSGGNLSAVPEADNSQESDTNGGNGGREDVRDSGDLFDNSQVDRSDTEQYSEQRWSDDEQNALPSPETQPLPGTTSKHPTQQRQHPVQSVPSQGGLPSRLPRNSHSQSVREQHALPRLPSSRGGVSLRLAATSHQSEQVRSNMPQLNVSQNRERSRTPTPVLLRSSSPVVSHHTPGRQAVGARRDGIHETREANQEDRRPSKKTRPDAMLSGRQSAAEELMDVDNAKANSGKGSARLGRARNTVIVKPTTLAFYPPLWTKLLDEAKARIRLYVATEEPFLRLETAVDGQCSEEIIELVVKYQEDQSELEAGFYPQYKRSMARMLFNDTQTFRSEIKKVAVRIVPIEYNLSAPKSATTERERLDAVKQKATVLLEGAKFLRGECDSLGKASNFAHPALQNICLGVYYSNSVKSLRQYVEFQHFVPYKALALAAAIVHSVLLTYERHGFSKAESLNVGELEDSYQRLLALMDTVALDTYHGPKLSAMLEDWAQMGMTGFVAKDPVLVKQGGWEVILD